MEQRNTYGVPRCSQVFHVFRSRSRRKSLKATPVVACSQIAIDRLTLDEAMRNTAPAQPPHASAAS